MFVEPTGLRIDVVTAGGGAATLCLSGELDADTAGALVADAEALVDEGHRHLALDCSDVTFCDSFGLRAMMLLWDRVQPDGTVAISQPSDTLTRILDITGLAEKFGLRQETA